jgi:hypothetical protein
VSASSPLYLYCIAFSPGCVFLFHTSLSPKPLLSPHIIFCTCMCVPLYAHVYLSSSHHLPGSTYNIFLVLKIVKRYFTFSTSSQGLLSVFEVSTAHSLSFSGAGSTSFHQTKDLSLGSF